MRSSRRVGSFASSWQIVGLAFLAATIITWVTGEWWVWLPVLAASSSLFWFSV